MTLPGPFTVDVKNTTINEHQNLVSVPTIPPIKSCFPSRAEKASLFFILPCGVRSVGLARMGFFSFSNALILSLIDLGSSSSLKLSLVKWKVW